MKQITDLNIVSQKTRSLFTIMVLSLFAISFTIISDAQTAYAIEVFPVDNAVTGEFDNISIEDVKADKNNVYLLYSDSSNLFFISSFDKGDNWNDPVSFPTGGGLLTEDRPLSRIFINDAGHIGVSWEDAFDPVELFFAVSTNNGESFGNPVDFEASNAGDFEPNGKDLAWSGDGDTVAVTFSDAVNGEFQAVMTSTNFGDTWNEPVVIQSVVDDSTNQNQGIILVDGMNMYVVWNADTVIDNNEPKPHVFFTNSTDNGATWGDPIQVSDLPIGQVTPKMILNEDSTKLLISWNSGNQEKVQAVSTDSGVSFGDPVILEDNSDCDRNYDIDNLGENVIFMCAGIQDEKRFVKLSSDFGQTYSSITPILGDDGIASARFPENKVTDDTLYSLWQNNGDSAKFLSFSEDKGQTFSFESLPDLESATIQNGVLSRQAVSDNIWYWFVQTSSTTIDFVKVVGEATDHYLGYAAKVKHDDHDDDDYDDKKWKKDHDDDDHDDKKWKKDHDDDDHEKIKVTLVDEFEGEANYDVKKLEMLFNPVDKNNEGIVNEESHLVAYDIEKLKGERDDHDDDDYDDYKKWKNYLDDDDYDDYKKWKNYHDYDDHVKMKNIIVTNQFGDITIDIKKAKMLLVPSNKTHVTEPTELEDIVINHFKCYDAEVSKHTPKFEKRTVDLKDQFIEDPIAMEVKKIEMLCSPVDKEGEGIVDDENFLMCYDLENKGGPKFKKKNVFINNQFGPAELEVKKPNLLCVPSTIVEPPVCEDDQVLDTETNTCVAPEFGLCGEGTTLIDNVCTIDETKRVHKHIHKHIHKHVHSYDSSYSEHEQDSDSLYSEHEQDSEQGPEQFSGSFIGKHKDNGTWKTTGTYTIDDDKFRKVKTTGPFSIETIDECKQISASGTIDFRNGDVNADFDLQKCDNSPKYTGTFIITGGTGEYEGATGSGGVTIQGSMKHFKGYLNGEISIPT